MRDRIIMEMDSEEILEIKAMSEVGVGSSDRQFRGNNRRNNRSVSNSRSRLGSKARTDRDRIRCFEH